MCVVAGPVGYDACRSAAKTLEVPKSKRKQVSTMRTHIKTLAALGVTALTALLLSALALTIKPIAEHRHETGTILAGTDAGRVGISDPAFYVEMANVNARMHDGMEIAQRQHRP
jgi:hypothetical protein